MKADDMRVALAKSCLAGLGLALAWVLVGGLLFLASRSIGLGQGLSLVIAIAGGPVIVSAVVMGSVILRAQRRPSPPATTQPDDAAATWDDA